MIYTIFLTNTGPSYVNVSVLSPFGHNTVSISPGGFAPMSVQPGTKTVVVLDIPSGAVLNTFSINVTGSQAFDVATTGGGGGFPLVGTTPTATHLAAPAVIGHAI